MTHTSAHNCICQSCSKIFAVNKMMVCSINFDKDCEISDDFLEYSLNKVTCPSCRNSFVFEMTMVIYSERYNFAICVRPSPDNALHIQKRAAPNHLLPFNLRYRECTYQTEAVEKCKIFTDGFDDRFIEYLKLHFFDDKDTLPFDELNMVYKSCDGENIYFEKIDYNNIILNQYVISKSDAYALCRNVTFAEDSFDWEVINRITINNYIR